MSDCIVYLECFEEGKKLRVRIVSPGYNPNANCQFPTNIRKKGKRYEVPPEAIGVASGKSGKFFYRIKKSHIKVLEDEVVTPSKIFTLPDCCICIDAECDIVIVECGHLCLCQDCSKSYDSDKCPLCRGNIKNMIHKDQFQ